MMKLMSICINTQPDPKRNDKYPIALFAMYQEKLPDGPRPDGILYGEPLYSWVDCENWNDVMSWLTLYPLGSDMPAEAKADRDISKKTQVH